METNKSDIQEIMDQIVSFTQDRDWEQFHNGKDLALALSIEASELNEAFLWKRAEDVNINKVKEELADVMNYAFLLANKYNLEIILEPKNPDYSPIIIKEEDSNDFRIVGEFIGIIKI